MRYPSNPNPYKQSITPAWAAHVPAGRDKGSITEPLLPSPRIGSAMMTKTLLTFCTSRDVSEGELFRWVANGEFLATPWTCPAVHKNLYLEKRR